MQDPFEVSESDALRHENAIDSVELDQRLTQAGDFSSDVSSPGAPQLSDGEVQAEVPQSVEPAPAPEQVPPGGTAFTERGMANRIETGVEKPEVTDFDRNAMVREGPPPGWSPGGERGG